jgi:hypothetical protein
VARASGRRSLESLSPTALAKPKPWMKPKTKATRQRRWRSFTKKFSTPTYAMLSAITGSMIVAGGATTPITMMPSVIEWERVKAVMVVAKSLMRAAEQHEAEQEQDVVVAEQDVLDPEDQRLLGDRPRAARGRRGGRRSAGDGDLDPRVLSVDQRLARLLLTLDVDERGLPVAEGGRGEQPPHLDRDQRRVALAGPEADAKEATLVVARRELHHRAGAVDAPSLRADQAEQARVRGV